ncbi:MAG: helix-turn-helix domain-containing protein [Terracidiphilus sp.]
MNIPPNSQLARILQARAAKLASLANPQPTPPASTPPSKKIAEIPARLRELEPAEPLLVPIDDPVFNTPDAAEILGVNADRLMKWRKRGQGPAYLQYEQNGPVRYELSALIEFKAAHRVRPVRQPHPGRRR